MDSIRARERRGYPVTARATAPARQMNRTESDYALVLTAEQRAGKIASYAYEALTLRLGNDCRYTPDFMVVLADGGIELHEVKGHMRDDARVKLRVVASTFPFRVVLVKRDGKGWQREDVKP